MVPSSENDSNVSTDVSETGASRSEPDFDRGHGSKGTVIVIGGGVGGLSAAIRSAVRGASVTLLEKNDVFGGKLNQWEVAHPGRPGGNQEDSFTRRFRFDTGPSLLTLPLVFADLFAFAGEDIRDHLALRRLDPVSRFVWRDGQTFELRGDRQSLLAEVARFAPGDVSGVEKLLDFGRKVWDISGEFFLTRSPEQALRGDGVFSPLNALRVLIMPLRIGMFGRYAKLVDRHIKKPRLREVFYQYATYSGASPFKAPATLGVIPHVELDQGGFHIEGGMYELARQLEALAVRVGVHIRGSTPVEKVLTEAPTGKKLRGVCGVRLGDGTTLSADAVIVNADVIYAKQHLIEPADLQQQDHQNVTQPDPGGSGMVLLLGVEGTYPQLTHHNKFMPDDYRSDLNAMFETRTLPDDPCIYVCASTRSDPTGAPAGCENLFILCSAPPLVANSAGEQIDWETAGETYRNRIVSRLENQFGLTDLESRIVVERRMTPVDLRQLYNANAGSIYGISGNGLRQAFLRPPNRDRNIAGLFYAGGATHPGGGLPLVALSGKIASELAAEYLAER